jgi:hypothetical protein
MVMSLTHQDVERAHSRARTRKAMRLLIAGELTHAEIAAVCGVPLASVPKIKSGERGARFTVDLRPLLPPSKVKRLDVETIRAIYTAAWDETPHTVISERYCVSLSLISAVKHRKKHGKHTTDLERERKARSR